MVLAAGESMPSEDGSSNPQGTVAPMAGVAGGLVLLMLLAVVLLLLRCRQRQRPAAGGKPSISSKVLENPGTVSQAQFAGGEGPDHVGKYLLNPPCFRVPCPSPATPSSLLPTLHTHLLYMAHQKRLVREARTQCTLARGNWVRSLTIASVGG